MTRTTNGRPTGRWTRLALAMSLLAGCAAPDVEARDLEAEGWVPAPCTVHETTDSSPRVTPLEEGGWIETQVFARWYAADAPQGTAVAWLARMPEGVDCPAVFEPAGSCDLVEVDGELLWEVELLPDELPDIEGFSPETFSCGQEHVHRWTIFDAEGQVVSAGSGLLVAPFVGEAHYRAL